MACAILTQTWIHFPNMRPPAAASTSCLSLHVCRRICHVRIITRGAHPQRLGCAPRTQRRAAATLEPGPASDQRDDQHRSRQRHRRRTLQRRVQPTARRNPRLVGRGPREFRSPGRSPWPLGLPQRCTSRAVPHPARDPPRCSGGRPLRAPARGRPESRTGVLHCGPPDSTACSARARMNGLHCRHSSSCTTYIVLDHPGVGGRAVDHARELVVLRVHRPEGPHADAPRSGQRQLGRFLARR